MNKERLIEFIEDTSTELDWRDDELVVWIHHLDIKEFCEMVGKGYFDEGGCNVNLQYGIGCYIALDLVPICECFEIEPSEILERS